MPIGEQKAYFPSGPGGIRRDVHPLEIPDGQWVASRNWISRRGVGQPRPGYAPLEFAPSALAAGDQVTGLHWRVPPNGQGAEGLVAHTATAAYDVSTGTDITGTWVADSPFTNQKVRMVEYFSAGTMWTARVNFTNAVDKWDGNPATDFVNIAAAPAGVDMTVLEPYLIVGGTGTEHDSITWSDANDIDTWPAINTLSFRETGGSISAVRALNSRQFAVFKPGGLWICTLQASRVAFQKTFIGRIRGPLNAAMVVEWNGSLYWWADDFCIHRFDGQSVQQLNSAIARFLMEVPGLDMQSGCMEVMHFDEPELWAFFPEFNAQTTHAVSYSLKANTASYHTFPTQLYAAETGFIFSTGGPFSGALVLGAHNGQLLDLVDYTTDDGTPIDGYFTTGWKPLTQLQEEGEVSGVISYWKHTTDLAQVTAQITLSNSISEDETTFGGGLIETNASESNHLFIVNDRRAKFVKLTHTFDNAVTGMEYRGASVLAWVRSQDE